MADNTIEHIEIPFEIKRLSADDAEGTFEGYAAVFNNTDLGNDVIAPGAFTASLKKRGAKGVKLLWQHSSSALIGKCLDLDEDKKGLKLKGKLTLGVQKAAETHALMLDDAITGLSIGYRPLEYEIDERSGKRTLTEIDLLEISVVTFPMNPRAGVTGVKSIRDWESILRDAGSLSKRDAKIAAKAVVDALDGRDAVDGEKTDDPFDTPEARDALASHYRKSDTEAKAANDSILASFDEALAEPANP